MIAIAIQLLWILIGVIVISAVIYFVFYVLKQVMAIPIPLLSLIAGGDASIHFPHLR
jgi:phosphoglycerol transferase MdoB-like AlkP superfamily enzyme